MKEVLIINALPEEMESVLNLMPNGRRDWTQRQITEGYFYYEVEVDSDTANPFIIRVTSQVRQGIVFASNHTGLMLSLKPNIVVMTGICAGNADKGVELGDVILSDRAFHYESGKQGNSGFKPEMECSNVDPTIVQWLNEYCLSKGGLIDVDGNRKLYVGPFATGSSVVARKEIFEDLQSHRERKVLALDMEAYSVLKTVELSNQRIPAIVIKGVCDFADPAKDDSAHVLAAKASAICMLDLLRFIVPLLPARIEAPPATTVSYTIPLPRPAETYRDRLLWRALLRWPDDYYEHFAKDFESGEVDENHPNSGMEFHPIGEKKWLVEVTVGFGAYQGTYRYYYLDETGTTNTWSEVMFRELYQSDDGEITESLTNELSGIPAFDPEASTITNFLKGRGLGDIGELVTYAFNDGATTLVEFRQNAEEQEFDDPDNFIPPEEWPKVDVDVQYPQYVPSEAEY